MTYEHIVSQAARRMGYSGYDGSLREDLKFAVNWAETELLASTNFTKNTFNQTLTEDKLEYPLPIDFSAPYEYVVLDASRNQIQCYETNYQQWLRYSPASAQESTTENELLTTDQSRKVQIENLLIDGKLLIAVNFQKQSGWTLAVKPAFSGSIQIYYSITPTQEIFDNLQQVPCIPESLHRYLVPGAVYQLAQIEKGKAINEKDYDRANLMAQLEKTAFQEFSLRKAQAIEQSEPQSKPAIMRPYMWYESGRKYSRNRGI